MLRATSSSVLRSNVVSIGEAEGARAVRPARAARPALPCLLSNNCTTEEKTEPLNILKGGHKRMAQVLFLEIMALVALYGIERIGFFTLTFADHVTSLREAQRRFRSIRAHVIVKRYERAIVVWERHESGRIHFHLVVVLADDIRTGANFAAFKCKDYRSANRALRAEWAFWRNTCPEYRFGRHELMPIKSNAKGIARYVGKYIGKPRRKCRVPGLATVRQLPSRRRQHHPAQPMVQNFKRGTEKVRLRFVGRNFRQCKTHITYLTPQL